MVRTMVGDVTVKANADLYLATGSGTTDGDVVKTVAWIPVVVDAAGLEALAD